MSFAWVGGPHSFTHHSSHLSSTDWAAPDGAGYCRLATTNQLSNARTEVRTEKRISSPRRRRFIITIRHYTTCARRDPSGLNAGPDPLRSRTHPENPMIRYD